MDDAEVHKCRCQDFNLVTQEFLAGSVLQGEVTLRFGCYCSQVYGVTTSRLSLQASRLSSWLMVCEHQRVHHDFSK